VDEEPWSESLDDDLDLAHGLKGRSWSDIPNDFIDEHSGDLVLLTHEAFAAFLPAWIVRSLDEHNGSALVLELTVYALRPGHFNESEVLQNAMDEWWQDRAAVFDRMQRKALRVFLQFVLESDRYRFLEDDAVEAIHALNCCEDEATSSDPA
jgi:hypothetical protein